MDWVIRAGLIELALGALLGWAMVVREERPEWLKRIGVVAPARIRQVHLDYVMMGLILIAVGLALPGLPTAVAVPLVFGTALSRDGRTVLGWQGGFEPGPNHRVVSIPYAGGRPTVLVRNATEPDWDR